MWLLLEFDTGNCQDVNVWSLKWKLSVLVGLGCFFEGEIGEEGPRGQVAVIGKNSAVWVFFIAFEEIKTHLALLKKAFFILYSWVCFCSW